MSQWRPNLNSKQRRNSRKPKGQPTATEVIDGLRVYDKPCNCNENKGQEPGHTHASAPASER